MSNYGRWADLLQQALAGRSDMARSHEVLSLSMLAGERVTVLGRPAVVTFSWPEGPPFGMTADEIRELASSWLREVREREEAA